MDLADEVLTLHRAILEAMVIENRAGELHIACKATRNDTSLLDAVNDREMEIIVAAPSMVLGAASQIGNVEKAGSLRLVGLLYEQRGSFCVPINRASYLMVATATESFLEVMKTLQDSLPRIMQKRNSVSETEAISSAVQADETVRSFFAITGLSEPSSVHLKSATLDTDKHSWQISGTYRPVHAVRSKGYCIELDARTGAITKFQAQG